MNGCRWAGAVAGTVFAVPQGAIGFARSALVKQEVILRAASLALSKHLALLDPQAKPVVVEPDSKDSLLPVRTSPAGKGWVWAGNVEVAMPALRAPTAARAKGESC
jgi:hypothetical protein